MLFCLVSMKKTQQTHALFLLLFNRKDMLLIFCLVSVKKTQQTHALFLLLFNRKDMLSIPLHLFILLFFYSIASLPVEPDPPDGKAPLFPENNPKSVPFPNLLPLALLLLCFPVNVFLLY
jgi:hypothetical protein